MSDIELITHSPEETQKLGVFIGESAEAGDVYLLTGGLGTGKTCLTQGIAWGLDIEEYALSPSFVIVRELKGRLPLYHMDLYRLERAEEIDELGLDVYFNGNGVCVIEWAEKALDLLPPENLSMELTYLAETDRRFVFKPKGHRYNELMDKLKYFIPNL